MAIFHLEHTRTTAQCVYNSSMSVKKGKMGLFAPCQYSVWCMRPNLCKLGLGDEKYITNNYMGNGIIKIHAHEKVKTDQVFCHTTMQLEQNRYQLWKNMTMRVHPSSNSHFWDKSSTQWRSYFGFSKLCIWQKQTKQQAGWHDYNNIIKIKDTGHQRT